MWGRYFLSSSISHGKDGISQNDPNKENTQHSQQYNKEELPPILLATNSKF